MRFLLCATLALLLSAGTCAAQEAAPDANRIYEVMMQPSPAVSEPSGVYALMVRAMSATSVLSQNDLRWKYLRLGPSIVGRIGCLSTDVAMYLLDHKKIENAQVYFSTLKPKGLVTARGDLDTQKVAAEYGVKIKPLKMRGGNRAELIRTRVDQGESFLVRSKHHWRLATQDEDGNSVLKDSAGPGKALPMEALRKKAVSQVYVITDVIAEQ